MEQIRILIVEDSLTQAMRLRFILENEGFSVDAASSGENALELLNKSTPDLIVSDVVMPGISGYELCKRIRSNPKLSSVPIMLVTTLSDPTDVIHALESGADNFVTKPYDDKTLISRIRYIMANMEIRKHQGAEMGVEVFFAGKKYFLNSSRIQMIDLLLSTYESAMQKNQELFTTNQKLKEAIDSITILQKNYFQSLETNEDAIVVFENDGLVRYANPSANHIFSKDGKSILDQRIPFELPGILNEREIKVTDLDGQTAILDVRTMPVDWDSKIMTMAVFRNITEAYNLRKELEQMSLTDDLTGFYNRRGFLLLADRLVKQAKRMRSRFFVLFADLDGLKRINDTYGHPEGDKAIVAASSCMKNSFRGNDILSRLGGDEFSVIGIINEEHITESLIERLENAIEAYNGTGQMKSKLSISFGLEVLEPSQTESLEAVIKKADSLMYENKLKKKANRS
jgi:two-component system cell cycle response regulator